MSNWGMDRRRSMRFRSQIHPSEDGAGLNRRRSPPLRPQTRAGEEGAGVTRRSPRLHPQIHEREEGTGTVHRIRRRRRHALPAAAASLPVDNDMLQEILLRIPPDPSSLPRASVVCKIWRGLLTDPKFHRQFCAHHQNPPLLGSFVPTNQRIVFAPILDPPNRIPPPRFDLGRCSQKMDLLSCRHGRLLVKDCVRKEEVIVCDPITGDQQWVVYPPDFRRVSINGAVLCAAIDHFHVHGGCSSSPFKVVLVTMYRRHPNRLLACVYSSKTGLWGDIISSESPCDIPGKPAVLVGNCLYWLSLINGSILEFDLDENNIAVVRGPLVTSSGPFINHQIIKAEDGAVGYAILFYPSFRMWKRNVNAYGVTAWVPWKTIEMDSIPGLPPRIEIRQPSLERIQGYDEDTNVIFLHVNDTVYMVKLKLMQSTKLCGSRFHIGGYHPFRSFYMPGIREGGEAAMLHHP